MRLYNSLTDIIGSPEFDDFLKNEENTTGFTLMDKIIKKKSSFKIEKPDNIVAQANRFFNSKYNEI